MKIKKQERKANTVFFEIEEEYSLFNKAVEKALQEAGKNIKLPGFRPGKAPKELLERSLDRAAVEAHAAQDLIGDLYAQLLDETKIEVVDYPKVEIVNQTPGNPFAVKIQVDVYPEVKLGKYKGLKVEKAVAPVTEDDIIKVLGNLQQRLAKKGPDGKTELLPLDDEFAKKVSSHGTLAALKEEVREVLQKDRDQQEEAVLKDKLIALASSEAKVSLPPGMVTREVNLMLDELKVSLSENHLTLEDYLKGIKKEEKTLREELAKSAEVRVKGKVVLRSISEAEKLTVSEEEMTREIRSLAESAGKSREEMEQSLGEGGKSYVKSYLLRKKALDLLIEKASIKVVKMEEKVKEGKDE